MNKNIFTIVILIVVFATILVCAEAQWLGMNSPAGGNISAITKSDERIYVGTSFGELYYSVIVESGEYKWKLMNLQTNERINDIIQIENIIFVGTLNGLYISENNGQDWVLEKFGYKYFSIYNFKYDNNILYLATGRGVSISKDKGITWQHFKLYEGGTEPNRGHSTNSVEARNDTIIATSKGASNYPTGNPCIWISYDAGENWLDITTDDIPIHQINSEVIVGDTVFIATNSGVYKSSLKHIKWYYVAGLNTQSYVDIEYDGERIYALTISGDFLYSQNKGYTWTYPAPHGIKPSDYYTLKILLNNDDVILTTTLGLLKTSDNAYTWYEINEGLISFSFSDIEVKDSEILLASTERGVFSSTDAGESWLDFSKGIKYIQKRRVNSLCKTDDALYTGAFMRGFLNVTSDNGQHWQVLSVDLPEADYIFIKEHKDYLFTATVNRNIGFYRVTKDGSSVDTMSYNYNNNLLIYDFVSGEQNIFVATSNYGVLSSEDEGITWFSISENLQDSSFNSVAYSDGTLYAGSSTGKLYATKDLGVNWEIIYHTPVDTASITKIKVKDDKIFFATRVNGMVMTEDCGIKLLTTDGKKIGNISNNIRHKWIYDIEFFAEDSIIVSTAKGLYKAAIRDFEYVSVEGEKLIGNYLYNYPPYPLPAKEKVSILLYWDTKLDINNAEMAVYNSSGAKICGKERISLSPNSNWSGIVTWDASGVLPGIYFLQIKHGTRTKSIKMLIE